MPIEKMLVVSTSHIDPNTAELLEQGIHFGISDVFSREYGYLMFTAAIRSAINEGNPVPKCLSDICDCAELDNATLILLDCDGAEDGRLQSWEW